MRSEQKNTQNAIANDFKSVKNFSNAFHVPTIFLWITVCPFAHLI